MQRIELPDGAANEVVDHSGYVERFTDLMLEQHRYGIFGKLIALGAPVRDGYRVEVFRALTVDPTTGRRGRKATSAAPVETKEAVP